MTRSSFAQGSLQEGIDRLSDQIKYAAARDTMNQFAAELNQEIGQSSLVTGMSATGWQRIGIERLANLGSSFTEPAWTLGPDLPVSFALNYIHLDYTKFNGEDIEDAFEEALNEEVRVEDQPFPGRTTRLRFNGTGGFDEISAEVYAFTGTIGLLSNLDFSVVAPLVDPNVDGEAEGIRTISVLDEFDNVLSENIQEYQEDLSGGSFGLGDVILRLKYGIFRERDDHPFTLSVGYDLKTPTGDEDELLGTGEIDHRVRMLMGRQFFNGRIYPALELGYLFSGTEDVGGNNFDAFEYHFALPILVATWYSKEEIPVFGGSLTISPDLIGRFSDYADKMDAGVSLRLAVGEHFVAQTGVRFAVKDDEGLVAPVVPTAGIEIRF